MTQTQCQSQNNISAVNITVDEKKPFQIMRQKECESDLGKGKEEQSPWVSDWVTDCLPEWKIWTVKKDFKLKACSL